ncbi:MAG: PhzF family phenazine biosynthesis protein [Betaproteobacteria bacterium]|nr:PhzF family phenazine biosynthesis protein [Betaproteobacteria bacterium]MBV9360185.1 PhzF family phenazine biosynthesis protein [Betaproteobacteria bacterium]
MRAFKQVDAFSDKPFRGNPVAVVLDGKGLDTAQMQHIARWTNLSETTFFLPSKAADYHLRIFSPTHELPFAGHPTIGSAHAALEAGIAKGKKIKMECGAGVLDLSVDDGVIYVRSPAVKVSAAPDVPKEIGIQLASGAPLLRNDVGPVWLTGEVKDAATLGSFKPDMTALAKWSISLHATGVTVFAPSGERDCAFHVRSFAPAHAIPEDPVCGSGNICVAAYLRHLKRAPVSYVARQGMQMGRDGRVHMKVSSDAIGLGGRAVTSIEGSIAT